MDSLLECMDSDSTLWDSDSILWQAGHLPLGYSTSPSPSGKADVDESAFYSARTSASSHAQTKQTPAATHVVTKACLPCVRAPNS